MENTNSVIQINQVVKSFGDFTAVDGVSFDIGRGEIFGLIGHNGAGKSTLFKMMLGLLEPTKGGVTINGQSVMGASARNLRSKIGYLPENISLWDNLSGLETLNFFANLKGISRSQNQALLDQVGLSHANSRPVRAYSKGMKQRLGFAQALMGNPDILFLDEPTNGLDPDATRQFWNILKELRAKGMTIIVTSHVLADLEHRIDRIAVLANGKLQALGRLSELREQFDLPVVLTMTVKSGAQTAQINAVCQQLLQEKSILSMQQPEVAGTCTLRIARSQKMQVLQAIMQADTDHAIVDLATHEPSLEEIFFSKHASAGSL